MLVQYLRYFAKTERLTVRLEKGLKSTLTGRQPIPNEQEQQRVSIGPGNTHFFSIRQVSSHVATLLHSTCGPAAASAAAAVALMLLPPPLLRLTVLCIGNLIIKNNIYINY